MLNLKQKGYTLIELMIVVLMIAIMAATVVPQLREVNNRNTLGEVANDVQQVAAIARAMAMQNRLATVLEIRNDALWINILDGFTCDSDIRDRCIQNYGETSINAGENFYDLTINHIVHAEISMCSLRTAHIGAGGNCLIESIPMTTGLGLCYNGSGQLFIRNVSDANAECTSTANPAPDQTWARACVPWIGGETPTPENDFSGVDIRFGRFDGGGGGSCVPGAEPSGNATGLPRQIIVPAGGHPVTRIPGV